MGVVPNARPRIVIGTTMRLIIKAAIAIVTALALPNRSPRIAGPMNGTAGAEAVRAANTLSLNEKRNTRAYKPTIAVNIATTNAISWTRSARGVLTVPTKSASGTAYNNTMRLRTDASFGPKSWRQAATKPSSRVKTIGASALRMVCTMAPLRLRDYADDAFRCGLRGHLANVVCVCHRFERCVGRKLAVKRIDMPTPGENHGLSHRLHFQRCDPIALGAGRPADYGQILRSGKDSERPKDVRRN